MVAAHQGVEIKELAGVGMGERLPQPTMPAAVAATGNAPKAPETKPGPPPVLTKRGADILVQVEKLLDDAAKTAERTTATEPPKPRSTSSSALAFPDSFAAASPGDAAPPRKN
jgi:penicillin-binding protein 1A